MGKGGSCSIPDDADPPEEQSEESRLLQDRLGTGLYMDLRLKVSDHELAHGIIELSDLPVEGCCAHVLKHVHKP